MKYIMISSIKNIIIKCIHLLKVTWLKKRNNIKGLKEAKLYGMPIIKTYHGSSIEIGKRFTAISSQYYNPLGVNHKAIIKTVSAFATIIIGDDVGVSGVSIVAKKSIVLGNGILLGSNVTIIDNDFHPVIHENRRYAKLDKDNAFPVYIEDNVFIGMNSIILKGVTIGKNSVIAAGSVVTKNIPSNCIAGGNPAKVIKHFQF